MPIKRTYFVAIVLLVLLGVAYAWCTIKGTFANDDRLGSTIQGLGVIVALIAAVVAVAVADRPQRPLECEIEVSLSGSDIGTLPKKELPREAQESLADHPDPLLSHQVKFTIRNTSAFTWEEPFVSFRLPVSKRHWHETPSGYVWTFRSNLYNIPAYAERLEFSDTELLSNRLGPFWNPGDKVVLWIRMILDDGQRQPFVIPVSLWARGCKGITQLVELDPSALLDELKSAT